MAERKYTKESDALVMASVLNYEDEHSLLKSQPLRNDFSRMIEQYHYGSDDPMMDREFAFLVSGFIKELKQSKCVCDKVIMVLRSRYRIAI